MPGKSEGHGQVLGLLRAETSRGAHLMEAKRCHAGISAEDIGDGHQKRMKAVRTCLASCCAHRSLPLRSRCCRRQHCRSSSSCALPGTCDRPWLPSRGSSDLDQALALGFRRQRRSYSPPDGRALSPRVNALRRRLGFEPAPPKMIRQKIGEDTTRLPCT